MTNIIDVALLTVLSLCAILMGAITVLVMIMCYQVTKREKDFKERLETEVKENGDQENL